MVDEDADGARRGREGRCPSAWPRESRFFTLGMPHSPLCPKTGRHTRSKGHVVSHAILRAVAWQNQKGNQTRAVYKGESLGVKHCLACFVSVCSHSARGRPREALCWERCRAPSTLPPQPEDGPGSRPESSVGSMDHPSARNCNWALTLYARTLRVLGGLWKMSSCQGRQLRCLMCAMCGSTLREGREQGEAHDLVSLPESWASTRLDPGGKCWG